MQKELLMEAIAHGRSLDACENSRDGIGAAIASGHMHSAENRAAIHGQTAALMDHMSELMAEMRLFAPLNINEPRSFEYQPFAGLEAQ